MKKLLSFAAVLATTAIAPAAASATSYYVSPSGSDANPGTQAAPWQTISKVNQATFQPGDSVYFQGGQTFADATLMPHSSGTADARIVFGSYGGGDANIAKGVFFASQDFLTFDRLQLGAEFQGGSSSGAKSNWITLKNSLIDFGSAASTSTDLGIYSNGDGWQLVGDVVQNIGNSGMLLNGDGYVIYNNDVRNVGVNPTISYGKHGVYLRVADAVVVGNNFSNYATSGVSARFHDCTVAGNTFTGGPIGITFYPYDQTAGTTRFIGNTITGTTSAGIYVNGGSGGTVPLAESFVIAYNTISPASGDRMNLNSTTGTYEVTDNEG